MDYSYWYSYLNRTIYLAQSSPHFLYSVTLNTEGEMIFHLPTQAHNLTGLQTAGQLTNYPTLSYFRSLFHDHRRPLYTMQNKSTMCNIFNTFNELIFFFKDTKYILHFLIFFQLFFKFKNMGLRCTRFNLLSHPSLLKSCQYQIPHY